MIKTNRVWKGLLVALLVTSGILIACQKDARNPSVTSAAKGGVSTPSTKYVTPGLTCDDANTTAYNISLNVTGGDPNGAPSGFSIQWMTKAAYDALNGVWPAYTAANTDINGDPISASFCKGSFSGNANISRYNLLANQTIQVSIGSFLFDNGASTSCPDELLPCTEYVFRIFAHGDNTHNRSDFSQVITCKTACNEACADTRHGFGYWKHHCDLIPAGGLTLGTVSYTPDQICTILNSNPSTTNIPVKVGKQGGNPANGLIILAHQLISAKLNGLDATVTQAADDAIGSQNVLTDYQPASFQAGLTSTLHKKNETCD